MKNNKKEDLKLKIEQFIIRKLEEFKKERDAKENDFTEEIGEINEFKNLSDVEKLEKLKEDILETMEAPTYDFSEEEVHKIELDLDEMEEHIKEVAEDIKLIDDMLKIKCNINGSERFLVDGMNCNIKPIMLLNVALITPMNLKIIDLELNDFMESIMDITLKVTIELEKGKYVYMATDVRTLYDLGLLTAVDSLFTEIELSPIEFRGIISEVGYDEFDQLWKFSM